MATAIRSLVSASAPAEARRGRLATLRHGLPERCAADAPRSPRPPRSVRRLRFPYSRARERSARSIAPPRAAVPWREERATAPTAPLEHAEPLDTAYPRRSSAMTIASPSIPSNRILVVLGRRFRTEPFTLGPATRSRMPRSSRSRSGAISVQSNAKRGRPSREPKRPERFPCPPGGRAHDGRRKDQASSGIPLRT